MGDYVVTIDNDDVGVVITGELSTVNLLVSDPGVAGPPNVLTIGTVTTGQPAASITGISPNQVLNLVFPTSARHVHTQGTASTIWTITHTLSGYPSVSVVDSANTVVFGEVNYVSTSQVVVNFTTAFSGSAYLT